MNKEFQAAKRYAKCIPLMKKQNRKTGVLRLLAKLKAAINHG